MNPQPPKLVPVPPVPKFCPECGGALASRFVSEESCDRLVCAAGHIVYLNPKLVAGAVPADTEGRVVLLRRGIEPAYGAWTFPAGFVELGETVPDAAVREAREEAGIEIRTGGVLGVYSYADAHAVMVIYLATVVGGKMGVSREALEVRTFSAEEIPWTDLAFRSTREALTDWVRSKGAAAPETRGPGRPG